MNMPRSLADVTRSIVDITVDKLSKLSTQTNSKLFILQPQFSTNISLEL